MVNTLCSMKIKYPEIRRGIPAEHDIIIVLTALLQKSGINKDDVSVVIIGGGRRNVFSEHGVKLQSLRPESKHSVPVYIGTGGETVEAFLSWTQNAQRIPAQVFYTHLSQHTNNKTFLVEQGQEKASVDKKTGVEPHTEDKVVITDTQATISNPEEETILLPENNPVPAGEIENAGTKPDNSQNIGEEERLSDIGYFNRPTNLHLAIVALLSRFEVGVPFSFLEFATTIIEELKLHRQPMELHQSIKIFLRRGFVVRLNPEISPSRYSLSPAATDFAAVNQPVLPEPRRRVTPRVRQSETKQTVSLEEQLKALKRKEDDYQTLLKEIQKVEEDLGRLTKDDLGKEEKDLKGQETNLEGRLVVIRNRLEQIAKIRRRIQETKEKLGALGAQAKNPTILNPHEEYVKLRQLLS